MIFVTIVLAEASHPEKLPISEWMFGAIALLVFAALAFVVWTYRDVAHRHNHKALPGAVDHAGAPGVSTHANGHPSHDATPQ